MSEPTGKKRSVAVNMVPRPKGRKPAAPKLGERGRDGLQATVTQMCRARRLRIYHTHRSDKSPSGFPDCVITGPGGTIFRELKGDDGQISAAQQQWIDALIESGQDAGFWWPEDLRSGRIDEEMRALARSRAGSVSEPARGRCELRHRSGPPSPDPRTPRPEQGRS